MSYEQTCDLSSLVIGVFSDLVSGFFYVCRGHDLGLYCFDLAHGHIAHEIVTSALLVTLSGVVSVVSASASVHTSTLILTSFV